MKVLLFSVLFSIVFHYSYIIRNNVKLNVEYIQEFQNVLVFFCFNVSQAGMDSTSMCKT